jgi:hypothetical protein
MMARRNTQLRAGTAPFSAVTAGEDERLVVSVGNALRLLNTSRTTLYRRLRTGDLVGFADGGRRKITLASIKQYIERRCFEEASLRQAKALLRATPSKAPAEQSSPQPR